MGEFQPLVELLQQVLPFAETVGEAALDSFAKAVGKRLGKEGDKTVANWARRLGTKLFEKLNPGELSPDSTDRGALEARLSKIAESDPDWARGIATLVQEGAQIGAIFIRDESQKIDANSVIAPRNFRDFIMPPAPTTAATPSRRHQLPADLADFTGREEEVERLEKLLGGKGGHAAISAIGGMGGVGKSALAIHVAHLLKDCYPDAQIVVELRGTSEQPKEPAEAMTEVIQAFHPEAQLPNDPAQLTQTYHSVLDGQRALILLDNAADAAQVRPLLPNPPVAAVVTSRRA
ncbi:MAG: hypothetical protein IH999_03700, partial [Proteobacteria bacterium]|nr:hypothetical protein [Pseudomonadota bacterium]